MHNAPLKTLHVVQSLDSPEISAISSPVEGGCGGAIICSIRTIRPSRRRRTVSEMMTVMDNVFDVDPNALDNEVRRLDERAAARRTSLQAQLSRCKIDVLSAERRHRFDAAAAWRLRRIVLERKPDRIRTWDEASAFWTRFATRGINIPIETTFNRTQVNCDSSQRVLRFDKPHQITRRQFLDALHLPRKSTLIGAVGPLVAHRRIKDLIWATELLRIVHDDTYLLVAGSGPEEWRLHRFRDQVRVRRFVRFLGDGTDYREWLPNLDFFWVGSKRRDDPTFLVKAMSAGIPVITTETADHSSIITHEQNGYVVKPGDRAAFARHTWRMINDNSLASQIGAAGRERILHEPR